MITHAYYAMKVLIVHNDYARYSGEEAVVDKMAILATPSDVESFNNAITSLWELPSECFRLGFKAHDKLNSQYSSEVIAERW